MIRLVICALFAMVLGASPALASFTNPVIIDLSKTVTGTSSQILPANKARRYLLIENVCAVNVGITINAAAVLGSAGTVTLLPGGSIELKDDFAAQNAFQGISASGSCDLTIWEIQ